MTLEAQERAKQVRALPHVKAWIKRFQQLAKDMPPEVWVFVASGVPCVMAQDEEGRNFMRGDGMDPDATIESFRGSGSWDGGDW